jgi:hypothetical protein
MPNSKPLPNASTGPSSPNSKLPRILIPILNLNLKPTPRLRHRLSHRTPIPTLILSLSLKHLLSPRTPILILSLKHLLSPRTPILILILSLSSPHLQLKPKQQGRLLLAPSQLRRE